MILTFYFAILRCLVFYHNIQILKNDYLFKISTNVQRTMVGVTKMQIAQTLTDLTIALAMTDIKEMDTIALVNSCLPNFLHKYLHGPLKSLFEYPFFSKFSRLMKYFDWLISLSKKNFENFKMSSNLDIDECLSGQSTCDYTTLCVNTNGSHNCIGK